MSQAAIPQRIKQLDTLYGTSLLVKQKYPQALSGGMKHRASIARMLANDPDVMLLDEPFAALDATTQQVLREQLLDIYEKSGRRSRSSSTCSTRR